MKVQYIENKQINKKKWDSCLQNSINTRIFGQSWYIEMVTDDWDAIIMDDYEAVMPLPVRKKNSFRYVYPPFFAPQMGIFSKTGVTEAMVDAFFKAIPTKFLVVEMRLNTQMKLPENLVLENVRTYLLDLVEPYDQLYAKFSKNTKRNIKKAESAGLFIMENGVVNDIVRLFRQTKIADKANFVARDYERLARLVSIHINLKMGNLWLVFDKNNNLQAGAFFIQYLNQAAFLFSGRGADSGDNGAMHFLINEYIKRNAGKNIVFDFCGSNTDSIARFYAGFGAIPSYYQLVRFFPGNSFLKKWQFKIYKNIKRFL
jgi:hypothetical protein